MIDLLKKTLLAGIGMTLMTKDKAEELAREIVKSAQLSADKGEEFVKEAVKRAERGRVDLEATIQRIVDETIKRTHLATRDDIVKLNARIDEHNAARHG